MYICICIYMYIYIYIYCSCSNKMYTAVVVVLDHHRLGVLHISILYIHIYANGCKTARVVTHIFIIPNFTSCF